MSGHFQRLFPAGKGQPLPPQSCIFKRLVRPHGRSHRFHTAEIVDRFGQRGFVRLGNSEGIVESSDRNLPYRDFALRPSVVRNCAANEPGGYPNFLAGRDKYEL